MAAPGEGELLGLLKGIRDSVTRLEADVQECRAELSQVGWQEGSGPQPCAKVQKAGLKKTPSVSITSKGLWASPNPGRKATTE